MTRRAARIGQYFSDNHKAESRADLDSRFPGDPVVLRAGDIATQMGLYASTLHYATLRSRERCGVPAVAVGIEVFTALDAVRTVYHYQNPLTRKWRTQALTPQEAGRWKAVLEGRVAGLLSTIELLRIGAQTVLFSAREDWPQVWSHVDERQFTSDQALQDAVHRRLFALYQGNLSRWCKEGVLPGILLPGSRQWIVLERDARLWKNTARFFPE